MSKLLSIDEKFSNSKVRLVKLKKNAESLINNPKDNIPKSVENNIKELLHELEVYEEELDVQTEELNRAYIDINKQNEKYSDLYNNAPLSYVTITPEGKILEANKQAYYFLNLPLESKKRQYFTFYLEIESRKKFLNELKKVFVTKLSSQVEVVIKNEDYQKEKVAIISISPSVDRQRVLNFKLILTDISLEKEYEKEIKRHQDELEILVEERTEALEESQKTLSTLLDNAGDLIFVHPLQKENEFQNFTLVNKTACKKLGYTEKELLELSPLTISFKESYESISDEVKELSYKSKIVFEGRLKKKDGSVLYTEINAKVVEIGNNKVVISIARDISERKRLENELKSKNLLLETSEKIAKLGSWENDLENNVLTWSEQTYEIFDFNPKTKIIYDQFIGKVHPNDLQKLKDAQTELIENKKDLNIEYRIITKGKKIKHLIERGFVSAIDKNGKVKKVNGFVQDITESKLLLEEVVKNEQTLNNILTSTEDLIFTLDSKQRHTSIYSSLFDKGIIKREDFIGKTPEQIVGKEAAKIHSINNRKALKGENVIYEWNVSINDKVSYYQTAVSPLLNEGKEIVGVVGIGREITKEKEIALQLKTSEIKYKSLYEQSPLGIVIADPKTGTIIDCNNSIAKLIKRDREDLIGKPQMILHPKNTIQKNFGGKFGTLKNLEENKFLSEQLIDSEGKVIDAEVKASPIEINNKKYIQGIFIDITERKEYERKLKESEENFRLLFEKMHESFAFNEIITDKNNKPIDYRFKMVNPAFERELGIKAKDIVNKRIFEVFPNTEKYWIEKFGKIALSGGSLSYNNYSKEFNKHYETVVFQPKPRHFAVFFWDITEQENQKNKLKQSEEILRSVTDNTFDLISKIDENFIITFVSKSSEFIVGYKPEELISQSPLDIVHPDDIKIVTKTINSVKELKEPEYFESRIKRKNGEYIWIETIAKIIVENNKFAGAVLVSREITQRKKAEEEMRKLKQAIDQSSASIVITDINGNIEFVNPRFTEITGYNFSEVIGQNPRVIKSNKQSKEFYKKLWDTISKGQDWKGELLNKRKNGELFWETATISPIKDNDGKITHYVGIKDEITEKKKMEEELENHRLHLEDLVKERTEELDIQNKFLSTLLNTIPNPVFVKNLKGEYIVVNNNFLEVIGTNAVNPIGKNVFDLFEPDSAEFYDRMDKELLQSGKPQTYEYMYSDKNGKTHASVFYKDVIKHNNEISGLIGIVIDISERKAIEIQMKQSLEKEKEWNALQKHLISMVSHELRTPLTTILSSADFLEMFGESIPREKFNVQIKRIQSSVEKLTNMIEDVLTISRADNGKIILNPVKLDIRKTIHEIIEETKMISHNSHTIEIIFNLENENIYFDENVLIHILTNLLSNAVKYSPEGGKIEIIIKTIKKELILEVKDNGFGIPQKDIPHLFQPFSRATNTDAIEGHGLGLAIIKKYVDLAKGSYEVKSELDKGTTFKIYLPINW